MKTFTDTDTGGTSLDGLTTLYVGVDTAAGNQPNGIVSNIQLFNASASFGDVTSEIEDL